MVVELAVAAGGAGLALLPDELQFVALAEHLDVVGTTAPHAPG